VSATHRSYRRYQLSEDTVPDDVAPDNSAPTDTAPGEPPIEHRAAVVDLLGVLAYGELMAFDRLAEEARMAAAEIGHFDRLVNRLRELGADPEQAMAPFVAPLTAFHEQTAPSTWLEGLVKAYVGDGLAADFYREIATFLDESTRSLVLDALADTGQADFAVREVRAAIKADFAVAGRLALWARRLVGEALTQAQRVAAERDALTELIIAGSGDLTGVMSLIKRITKAHGDRMEALGLSS
jgi:hypothetical protein